MKKMRMLKKTFMRKRESYYKRPMKCYVNRKSGSSTTGLGYLKRKPKSLRRSGRRWSVRTSSGRLSINMIGYVKVFN